MDLSHYLLTGYHIYQNCKIRNYKIMAWNAANAAEITAFCYGTELKSFHFDYLLQIFIEAVTTTDVKPVTIAIPEYRATAAPTAGAMATKTNSAISVITISIANKVFVIFIASFLFVRQMVCVAWSTI